MANAFRSFLEKLGLVAPSTEAPQAPAAAPSTPPAPVAEQAPMHVPEPEAPAVPQDIQPVPEAEVKQCNSDHVECMNDPKGCCELHTPHDGMQHACNSCKEQF